MESAMYPKVGVGGIVLQDGKVLLLLRKNPPEAGSWSLPGGRVEFMERLEDAVVRELREELGITVEVESLVCVVNHIVREENAHWVAPAYRVRVVSGVPKNLEPEKTAAIEWFLMSDLPVNLSSSARSALAAFRTTVEHDIT
jgi:ADP-ribose pyrophosphatase YjhB (NUDIX family)